MKNFFLLLIAMLAIAFTANQINPVNAQLVKTLTPEAANDTLTNADTAMIYISAGLGSNTAAVAEATAVSVEASLTRLSGTAAGSVTLQGSIDGSTWHQVDTDNFTNVASQSFVYDMRSSSGRLLYKQYRLLIITSGTVSAIPKAHYLRRSN